MRELFVKEELYVLFMLSDRYYQSPNCLNEMGAAWIVKSKYTTFLLPGFTFAEMEGAVDPRKISIKLDDEEDIVRYRLGEFRDAISTCFSITTRLSEARWEKVRNDFLKDIEMQNTVVDMRKSDSFCIMIPVTLDAKLPIKMNMKWMERLIFLKHLRNYRLLYSLCVLVIGGNGLQNYRKSKH